MSSTHIVSIYDEELKYLSRRISEMGGTAEQMVADSVRALVSTDVALAHGFVHLGRFSAQYRAQFGCLPSQTLNAPTALAA